MEDTVILVDESGAEVGVAEKMAAHRTARLHRAFSIFIFHPDGRMLLQQRAAGKYHSAGLWTNACCSHPRPGESTADAAHRRLQEEMGFDCELEEIFHFTYQARLDNGLSEHEYDHVFIGAFDGTPSPNPDEAGDWKWIAVDELQQDVQSHPEQYTHWFRLALDRVLYHREGNPRL